MHYIMSRITQYTAFFLVVSLLIPFSNGVLADVATIPPGDIINLAAVTVGSTTAQLSWSAVGADGYVDRATSYDLRYSSSTTSFNSAMWNSYTRAVGTPTPGNPGASESFTLTNLTPSTTYRVAVRAVDSFGILSQAFNVVTLTTTVDGSSSVSNVVFRLRLESIAIPSSKSVTITLYTAGTLNSVGTIATTTDSSGYFSLPETLAITGGLYDIAVSSPLYLNAKVFEYNLSSNATVVLPILQAGDLNSDNIINSLDWSVMSGRWFSNDASADINSDGIVNSLDWSVMSGNWFQTGA